MMGPDLFTTDFNCPSFIGYIPFCGSSSIMEKSPTPTPTNQTSTPGRACCSSSGAFFLRLLFLIFARSLSMAYTSALATFPLNLGFGFLLGLLSLLFLAFFLVLFLQVDL